MKLWNSRIIKKRKKQSSAGANLSESFIYHKLLCPNHIGGFMFAHIYLLCSGETRVYNYQASYTPIQNLSLMPVQWCVRLCESLLQNYVVFWPLWLSHYHEEAVCKMYQAAETCNRPQEIALKPMFCDTSRSQSFLHFMKSQGNVSSTNACPFTIQKQVIVPKRKNDFGLIPNIEITEKHTENQKRMKLFLDLWMKTPNVSCRRTSFNQVQKWKLKLFHFGEQASKFLSTEMHRS